METLEKKVKVGDIVKMTDHESFGSIYFAKGTKCQVVEGDNDGPQTCLMRLSDKVTLYVDDNRFRKIS